MAISQTGHHEDLLQQKTSVVSKMRKALRQTARPERQLMISRNRTVIARHLVFYLICLLAIVDLCLPGSLIASLLTNQARFEDRFNGIVMIICLMLPVALIYTLPIYFRIRRLRQFSSNGCPACGESVSLIDFRHHISTDHQIDERALDYYVRWFVPFNVVNSYGPSCSGQMTSMMSKLKMLWSHQVVTPMNARVQAVDHEFHPTEWIIRQQKRQIWPGTKPPLVIDARNLCTQQIKPATENQPAELSVDMSVIFSVWEELLRQKQHCFWVFDANTRYLLPSEWQEFYTDLLRFHAEVMETIKGQRADEYVLIIAEACGGIVVSADRFAPYVSLFDWLDQSSRFLRPSIRSRFESIKLGTTEIEIRQWSVEQAKAFLNQR